MDEEITTNQLRAISALMLLVLAIATMYFKVTSSTNDIILVALASFLVGGALLTTNKKPTTE